MYRFEWRRDTSHVSRYKFNENLVIMKKKAIKKSPHLCEDLQGSVIKYVWN